MKLSKLISSIAKNIWFDKLYPHTNFIHIKDWLLFSWTRFIRILMKTDLPNMVLHSSDIPKNDCDIISTEWKVILKDTKQNCKYELTQWDFSPREEYFKEFDFSWAETYFDIKTFAKALTVLVDMGESNFTLTFKEKNSLVKITPYKEQHRKSEDFTIIFHQLKK